MGHWEKIKPKESDFFENKSDIESRLSANAAVFTPRINAYFEAQKKCKAISQNSLLTRPLE